VAPLPTIASMAVAPFSKRFGAVVRIHRLRLQYTQEQLAEAAGIHATYVGMVERGERNCSLDIAAAIADALRSPFWELIEEAERHHAPATGRVGGR